MVLSKALAVIILNWNAAEDTIRCVRGFTGWKEITPLIWVVDNASAPEEVERIEQACPQVHLIRNEENQGFSGGNNRGIEEVLTAGIQAPVLLLNNDAYVEEESLFRLLRSLEEDPRIGSIGPLLFDQQSPSHLLAAGGRNPVLHHQSHILHLAEGPHIRDVGYVPGTVIIIRPSLFRTIGLFDERYFFSMEVADFCYRAAQAGFRNVIDVRAKAYHELGRSASVRGTLHIYYIIRNRFLFIRKFYPRAKWALMSIWAAYSLALWGKVSIAGQQPTARAVLLGLFDGLRGHFGGQNSRVLAYTGRG